MIGPFEIVVAFGVLTPLALFAYDRKVQIAATSEHWARRFHELPLIVRRLLGSAMCLLVACWCIYGLVYPGPNFNPVSLVLSLFVRFCIAPPAIGGAIGCLRGRFGFDVAVGVVAVFMMLLTAGITAAVAERY